MRGWDFLWLLAPTALWLAHFLFPLGGYTPPRSAAQAGAKPSPLSLAPAPPSSATEPSDALTDGWTASVAVPARSGASVAGSSFEVDGMRINREAVDRLYGGAA